MTALSPQPSESLHLLGRLHLLHLHLHRLHRLHRLHGLHGLHWLHRLHLLHGLHGLHWLHGLHHLHGLLSLSCCVNRHLPVSLVLLLLMLRLIHGVALALSSRLTDTVAEGDTTADAEAYDHNDDDEDNDACRDTTILYARVHFNASPRCSVYHVLFLWICFTDEGTLQAFLAFALEVILTVIAAAAIVSVEVSVVAALVAEASACLGSGSGFGVAKSHVLLVEASFTLASVRRVTIAIGVAVFS